MIDLLLIAASGMLFGGFAVFTGVLWRARWDDERPDAEPWLDELCDAAEGYLANHDTFSRHRLERALEALE